MLCELIAERASLPFYFSVQYFRVGFPFQSADQHTSSLNKAQKLDEAKMYITKVNYYQYFDYALIMFTSISGIPNV